MTQTENLVIPEELEYATTTPPLEFKEDQILEIQNFLIFLQFQKKAYQ